MLWSLLNDNENARLFPQVYLRTCRDLASFYALMKEHQDSSYGRVTYTVVSNETGRAVGWTLTHSFTTTPMKSFESALFLPERRRTECVFETMNTINEVLFDELSYDQVNFRRSSRVETSAQAGEVLGTSLVGILRRQLLNKERSEKSDMYTLTKEVWPSAKVASNRYLDSHPIELQEE